MNRNRARGAWLRDAAVLVCWLALASPADAHPAPFSYVDVRFDGTSLQVAIIAHVLDVAHELGIADPAELLDAERLRSRRDAVVSLLAAKGGVLLDDLPLPAAPWSEPELLPERDALRVQARVDLPGGRLPARVAISGPMFPYDPIHLTYVNVYEHGSLVKQGILSAARPDLEHFTGTRQGRLAVVRRFAAAGVHHILIGPDHLLFLVGLLLMGGSVRRLVLVVSAFTLAHSVTLSLAVLGLVSPPGWVVEPAIALSIVYVGADNLIVQRAEGPANADKRLQSDRGEKLAGSQNTPRDVRAWIALGFGLIHGFGFAGVLREMELPAGALGWSLLSFNLGVEAGQVLVVAAVAGLLGAVRRRSEAAGRRIATVGSVAVVAAGAFWFVERTFLA